MKNTNRVTKLGHKLNWSPDLPDQRDLLYQVSAPVDLPEKVDLRIGMPPIVNQGRIGSCTANALAGNLGYLQVQELQIKGKQAHEFNSKKFIPASRLFIYYNARVLIGMQKQDSGSYIRDGIKTLNQMGVCSEPVWPYETKRLYKAPTKGPVNEANLYKINKYQRLTTLYQMQQCLADLCPFTFGFSLYESFES